MPSAARRTHAVRVVLARLVVVLALLVAVAGVIGLHCADDMGTQTAASAVTEHHTTMPAKPDHDPSDMDGMLITCLAFLIAVVTATSTPRREQLRAIVHILRSARALIGTPVLPRAPRLAELCQLRT